jgi:DNA helicase-2/ATP-dependent DNA helicase PcrA
VYIFGQDSHKETVYTQEWRNGLNLDGLKKRAVKQTEGPVLIIAGAGSGKTRVLTNRIAYLIDECGISPYNILAITFTNKAAAEMRERVEKVTDCGSQVWVSTFHSTCVRILRRYIDRIGYQTNFTIYDTDDQKSVIRDACKKLNIDTKMLKERTIMSAISSAKDEMISPDEMEANAGGDYNAKRIAGVYREYQKTLKANNALDFDDLIFKTVELLNRDEEVLEAYQERFRYIMVDEYQDTNTSQFRLISKLAQKYGNLCVVGDDDQSIYKFRGANIGNILNFENTFPGAKVIKLEQNYRSTQTILSAANEVIAHNIGRKSKKLWTENGKGDKIHFRIYEDAYKEAEGVVENICACVRDGWNYNDIAVLYRTNAQSRLLEEKLIVRNVPYRIYGGINFYQRKEIKDILAYLKTIDNGMDGQAVKRIINVPRRGIGATTLERVQEFADANDMTFWDALCNAAEIPNIGRGLSKIESFVTLILGFQAKKQFLSIRELTETILEDTRYMEALAENETKEEVEARQENIDEFMNKIVSYEEQTEGDFSEMQTDGENPQAAPTLSGFLEEVALIADIDNLDQDGNQVMLMTLHSAKGLEFPIVYMTGLEDGLFPSYMTIMSDDPTEVEEERRLCYVGITRAQKELNISAAKTRMIHGETQMNKVSRFVKEIPENLLEVENHSYGSKKSALSFGGEDSGESQGRFDFRANAKAALSRYGSGTTTYGQGNKKVAISGQKGIGSTYATNYGRTPTNYGTGNFAQPNKKVGFGKEFPMDIFDLKKPAKTATSYSMPSKKATGAVKPSGQAAGGTGLGYRVGDTVSHVKFGTGQVLAIEDGMRDYMVTVQFEEFGTKKMLAGFAKLKKQ